MSRTTSLPIAADDDVVRVRSEVRDLALGVGFDRFSVVAIATAASELARNTWIHGRGGTATVEEVEEHGLRGLRITFRDSGPGIADIERVLKGGYSTRRSLGLGLSGAQRLVDEFKLDSTVGVGTVVVVAKWAHSACR